MSDEPEKKTLVEDVGGEMGFRVAWEFSESWADFKVYKVRSFGDDGPAFPLATDSCRKETPDITLAETHLEGFFKWDGCCEFWRAPDTMNLHCCGANDVKMTMVLLKYLYIRASELMPGFDDPWNADDKKLPEMRKS